MLDTRIGGVELWAINTNAQALGRSKAKVTAILNIGSSVTSDLGTGGDPRHRSSSSEKVSRLVDVFVGAFLWLVGR